MVILKFRKLFSIGLMDIDNIIYEYFTKVINPQVSDSNDQLISVPVRHASPKDGGNSK